MLKYVLTRKGLIVSDFLVRWHCACVFFFFNDTATTEIYTLSLHDALPISTRRRQDGEWAGERRHRRLDALGRLVYLVPGEHVYVRRGGRTRARPDLPDRRAVVPSHRGAHGWGRQHQRASAPGRRGSGVPAPEHHPARGALGRRAAAVASRGRRARRARPETARGVRLHRRPG